MRLHIQTKNLSGWQTVASFSDEAEATAAYQHVFRDYSRDLRLVVESADGFGCCKARATRGEG